MNKYAVIQAGTIRHRWYNKGDIVEMSEAEYKLWADRLKPVPEVEVPKQIPSTDDAEALAEAEALAKSQAEAEAKALEKAEKKAKLEAEKLAKAQAAAEAEAQAKLTAEGGK